jgi:hypothetical protein
MSQINFVNKTPSITLEEETFTTAKEQTEAAPEPKITEEKLCKDLLMMSMFR